MKTLLLSLLLALSSQVNAQGSLLVDSLNQGSCWMTQTQDGVSLASFNEHKSKVLTGPEVQGLIEETIGVGEGELRSLRSYVHCSSHSLAIVFNVTTERGSFCLWSGLGEGPGLVVRNLGHLGEARPNQFCDGAVFGELIVVAKSAQAIIPLKAELTQLLGNAESFKVKALGERIFKITLAQKFQMKESEVKDALLKSPALLSEIKAVEFSSLYHPIGEVKELEVFRYDE